MYALEVAAGLVSAGDHAPLLDRLFIREIWNLAEVPRAWALPCREALFGPHMSCDAGVTIPVTRSEFHFIDCQTTNVEFVVV